MSYVSAIIVAAGEGRRFHPKAPKLLVKIKSKPIIIYSLRIFNQHPLIKDIIVVVNSKNREAIIRKIKQYRITKVSRIVEGGRRRQDSVYNGLKATPPQADLILIHDAARPFIDEFTVTSAIKEAKNCGAAIVGVPVKATIKEAAGRKLHFAQRAVVKKTLSRDKLWEIQTPQVFRKDLIFNAYRKLRRLKVTDDAMLAEKSGIKVSIVMGSYNNIKITTPEDLAIAEAIAKCKT